MAWLQQVWNLALPVIAFALITVVVFFFTLPTPYSHFHKRCITGDDFSESRKNDAEKSGYAYFNRHKDADSSLAVDISVQVVVLGDIGRSPRMQYHALSLASHGAQVDIVGYVESDVHDDIPKSRFIQVVPIQPFSRPPNNKILFLVFAPFKVVYQIWSLYYTLAYRTEPARWMLVQNPPSIPTLAVCRIVCFLRNTRLVIDWHNYGYSILALRLGEKHPLVKIAQLYEGFSSAHGVHAHFAVTNAMARDLKRKWGIENALCLHDRPAEIFQPLSPLKRTYVLHKIPETADHAQEIMDSRCRLVVSSTSWTPDEDFQLFLDALVQYSSTAAAAATSTPKNRLPSILAVITGKGPQKAHYLQRIAALTAAGKLHHVTIRTAWLALDDYACLLGAADLGVSLHTSSSGVDLPMKVVDMFGTGLPVAGFGGFEAWPELVREGDNGRGFTRADELARILVELFEGDAVPLHRLRRGAMRECKRRWSDEWMPVAGKLFQLKP